MDAGCLDGISRTLGNIVARRPALGLLAGTTAGLLGLVESSAKKKKKKVTLCLNGATIKVPKKKKKTYLNRGATTGACAPCVGACTGKPCGAADGCDGTCGCASGQVCHGGTCMACNLTCASTPEACGTELGARIVAGGTIYACPGRYIGNFIAAANDVTIVGAGNGGNLATDTILDGNNEFGRRVLLIDQDRTVHLEGLRVTGGNDDGPGGGIHNEGTLTIARCAITGNTTTSGGGGISQDDLATGALTITDSTISGNTCLLNGGGLIQASSTHAVTFTNCEISGNRASEIDDGKGGGIHVVQGTVNVTGGSISGNRADDGGGIFAEIAGTVNLSGVTFSGNVPNPCVNVAGCPA